MTPTLIVWPLYFHSCMALMKTEQFLKRRVRQGGVLGFICVYPWLPIKGLAWLAHYSTQAVGEGISR